MSELVPVKNRLKAAVHTNNGEFLVYLSVPAAGGDGLLLGVTETEEAAEAIASQLNLVFGLVHTHA